MTWVPPCRRRSRRSRRAIRSRPACRSPHELARGLDLRAHRAGREFHPVELGRRQPGRAVPGSAGPSRVHAVDVGRHHEQVGVDLARQQLLARSLSMTASTPTSWRSASRRVHRRDAAAAGADDDHALLEQPADRPDLEDPLRLAATARPAASSSPSGLNAQPFSAASASRLGLVVDRPDELGRVVERRVVGVDLDHRQDRRERRARTAAGCRAPARGGSRSSPRSRRRGRRAGRPRRPCTPRACSASRPTCGPLPCERTSSCSRGDARPGPARRPARWRAGRPAVIGSPRFSRALPPRATTTRIGSGPVSSPSVATMTALIVCIRFSAWSKTIERSDSKTSSVTSRPSSPKLLEDLLADLGVAVVEGRQAVHELHRRVAGARDQRRALTWYGVRSLIRSSQTLLSSPIETQTSV